MYFEFQQFNRKIPAEQMMGMTRFGYYSECFQFISGQAEFCYLVKINFFEHENELDFNL